MLTPTPLGAVWPARLAYVAAALFTAASGGTNLVYGWNKGADLSSSFVWSAVSVGVSIVFALSWPALLRNIDAKQWSRASVALIAMVVTGAYSISAALGSAMGGRSNAASMETAISDARARAQTAYEGARNELSGLKPSRSVAELETLLAAAKPVCRIVVQLGERQTVCSPPVALVAELGRAKRRAELETKMEKASAELTRIAPARLANSDAVVLASYVAALGVALDPDTANRLLSLLAVLVIECGGGLALAVGLSLSERPEPRSSVRLFAEHARPRVSVFSGNTAHLNGGGVRTPPGRSANAGVFAAVRDCSRNAVRQRLVEALRERGGPIQTSIRRLALHLGTTPTTLHTVTRELLAAGVVAIDAGRQGSVFRLLVASAAHR
jgi:hypothetical protein